MWTKYEEENEWSSQYETFVRLWVGESDEGYEGTVTVGENETVYSAPLETEAEAKAWCIEQAKAGVVRARQQVANSPTPSNASPAMLAGLAKAKGSMLAKLNGAESWLGGKS
jgi:hypothetical protein